MDGKRLFNSIWLRNLLSYGPKGVGLLLEPLNVLIGPNASGKSNLIEAIGLLAAAPRDISKPLREGGGTSEWIWKGLDRADFAGIRAEVEQGEALILYSLEFFVSNSRFEVKQESVSDPLIGLVYYYEHGKKALMSAVVQRKDHRKTAPVEAETSQSVLSQFKGADTYPELTFLGNSFSRIAFFRGSALGRFSAPRLPQKTDLPEDFLLEDASNLGLVLNDLQHRSATKRILIEKLRGVYESLEDVTTKVQGGTIQIFFHERGLEVPVPAARLSDGTLQYLCLLTILLHPDPPPLVCIEEPELGLHPDVIPMVADLLRDAAQRTQLIVTTHSETLVSRLSDVPEAIVVCERDDEGTHLRRLEPEKLREWLDKYMLGELWRMGEIGGNRW